MRLLLWSYYYYYEVLGIIGTTGRSQMSPRGDVNDNVYNVNFQSFLCPENFGSACKICARSFRLLYSPIQFVSVSFSKII